jgi:hypothetical protein
MVLVRIKMNTVLQEQNRNINRVMNSVASQIETMELKNSITELNAFIVRVQ